MDKNIPKPGTRMIFNGEKERIVKSAWVQDEMIVVELIPKRGSSSEGLIIPKLWKVLHSGTWIFKGSK